MTNEIPSKNWWRQIPVPNLCEWQIMKKIAQSDGNVTRYYLAKYSKTFGECECMQMTEYKINKLLQKWKTIGLINLKSAYKDANILLPSMTTKGIEFMGKVGSYLDSPST